MRWAWHSVQFVPSSSRVVVSQNFAICEDANTFGLIGATHANTLHAPGISATEHRKLVRRNPALHPKQTAPRWRSRASSLSRIQFIAKRARASNRSTHVIYLHFLMISAGGCCPLTQASRTTSLDRVGQQRAYSQEDFAQCAKLPCHRQHVFVSATIRHRVCMRESGAGAL